MNNYNGGGDARRILSRHQNRIRPEMDVDLQSMFRQRAMLAQQNQEANFINAATLRSRLGATSATQQQEADLITAAVLRSQVGGAPPPASLLGLSQHPAGVGLSNGSSLPSDPINLELERRKLAALQEELHLQEQLQLREHLLRRKREEEAAIVAIQQKEQLLSQFSEMDHLAARRERLSQQLSRDHPSHTQNNIISTDMAFGMCGQQGIGSMVGTNSKSPAGLFPNSALINKRGLNFSLQPNISASRSLNQSAHAQSASQIALPPQNVFSQKDQFYPDHEFLSMAMSQQDKNSVGLKRNMLNPSHQGTSLLSYNNKVKPSFEGQAQMNGGNGNGIYPFVMKPPSSLNNSGLHCNAIPFNSSNTAAGPSKDFRYFNDGMEVNFHGMPAVRKKATKVKPERVAKSKKPRKTTKKRKKPLPNKKAKVDIDGVLSRSTTKACSPALSSPIIHAAPIEMTEKNPNKVPSSFNLPGSDNNKVSSSSNSLVAKCQIKSEVDLTAVPNTSVTKSEGNSEVDLIKAECKPSQMSILDILSFVRLRIPELLPKLSEIEKTHNLSGQHSWNIEGIDSILLALCNIVGADLPRYDTEDGASISHQNQLITRANVCIRMIKANKDNLSQVNDQKNSIENSSQTSDTGHAKKIKLIETSSKLLLSHGSDLTNRTKSKISGKDCKKICAEVQQEDGKEGMFIPKKFGMNGQLQFNTDNSDQGLLSVTLRNKYEKESKNDKSIIGLQNSKQGTYLDLDDKNIVNVFKPSKDNNEMNSSEGIELSLDNNNSVSSSSNFHEKKTTNRDPAKEKEKTLTAANVLLGLMKTM